MFEPRPSVHLGLEPRCAACADRIVWRERSVALYGNEDSTAYEGRTRPFLFPPTKYSFGNGEHFLCRAANCHKCATGPESVSVHYECFFIFLHECPLPTLEALAHLWAIGLRHRPYPRSPALGLTRSTSIDLAALTKIAKAAQLDRLLLLPIELIHEIHRVCSRELFWRAQTVVSLAASISTTPEPLQVLEFSAIESWKRGGPVVPILGPHPRWIRLSIDEDGICEIERLVNRPGYTEEHHNDSAYIVDEESQTLKRKVLFKDGYIRFGPLPELERPPRGNLRIWDTPTPPEWENCVYHPMLTVPWERYRLANLAKSRGITFFFVNSQIRALYNHESAASSAMSTFENIPERIRDTCAWIHMPVGERDTVNAIGSGHSGYGDYILIRTELTGDTVIGTPRQSRRNDRLLSSEKPITLVYGDPPHGVFTPPIGSLPPTHQPSPGDFEFQAEQFAARDKTYYSSAPLENIATARVFYEDASGVCLGILIEYANGGLKAVGQCRINVDPSVKYAKPSRIWIRRDVRVMRDELSHDSVCRVRFESDGDQECHEDDSWRCYGLEGTLRFWFSVYSTRLDVGPASYAIAELEA